MKLKIAVRVDASRVIGSGHIFRCQTLAQKFRSYGHDVHFICRPHDGHMMDEIQAWGFEVNALTGCRVKATEDHYASWLGAPILEDAQQTLQVLQAGYDLLIADHYGVDASWSRVLRHAVKKIAVFDDLANRMHDCDLILDTVPRPAGAYKALTPHHCVALLGPRYSLLREEFVKGRQKLLSARDGSIASILVFFGAADRSNETLKFLKAVNRLSELKIKVKVIIGRMNTNAETIKKEASRGKSITISAPVANLAQELESCDLFVGAAGVTTWERCCLGVPSAVISVAANQLDQARMAHELGLLDFLGDSHQVDTQTWEIFLRERLTDHSHWREQSQKALAYVDGLGTERVVQELLKLIF